MLSKLIADQQKYVNAFFQGLDIAKMEALVEKLAAHSGMLFFSGIGKSGYIAQKIASTLISTGTKALYISPVNALHGDIGMVSSGDHVLLISKSGESEEMLRLLQSVRTRGAFSTAIVCNASSRLGKEADNFMYLPLERELCPFDLSPTTSAAIQIIFGDILAVALMHKKAFSLARYAENHPLGLIGKRSKITVADLMLKGSQIPLAQPDQKLIDLLVELSDKRCGCLLIVDKNMTLRGIFTDGDLRRTLQEKGLLSLQMTMEELSIGNPRVISPEKLAYEALKEMERKPGKPITSMPVIYNNKVVGIIKLHDILQEV